MKPPPFEYRRAEHREEALGLLAEHGDEAKILAGGQSLMPLLAFRLARPAVIVDINRLAGLDELHMEDGALVVGSLTRHRAIEKMGGIAERCPLIADAISHIGHVAIRNRGSVGGSIAHADPAAEWPVIALLLDAQFEVESATSSRTIAGPDMFSGYMQSGIAPDEMLTRLRFQLPSAGAGSAFLEVARRHGDFAMAGAGVVLRISDGRINDARIGLMAAGLTPIRATDAESMLLDQEPADEVFEMAARAVDPAIAPLDDVHGPADYKRNLAYVLTRRALHLARDRAGVT